MILQALYEYYERKSKLGDIAPIGWIKREIGYLIEINMNGEVEEVTSLIEYDEKTKKFLGKPVIVPCIGKQALKHTNSGVDANFLWDNAAFVLGRYPEDSDNKTIMKKKSSRDSFYNLIKHFNKEITIKEVSAVLSFLEKLQNEDTNYETTESIIEKLTRNEISTLDEEIVKVKDKITKLNKEDNTPNEELLTCKERERILTKELSSKKKIYAGFLNGESNPAITFRIYGQPKIIFELPEVKEAYTEYFLADDKDSPRQRCLITGKSEIIEPKHLVIKGVYGGQSSGGAIVSFNKESFCSYGKIGKLSGYNAPVGQKAANGYTQALNHLLSSENRVSIADTSIVFWAEKKSFLEKTFPLLLVKPKDDPDKGTLSVKQLYESINSGKFSIEDSNRFFILGLAPNAARIAIRYRMTGTVAEFAMHIKQHFNDFEIVRDKDAPDFFALSSILTHAALKYKLENLAPNLAGQVTEAVLNGTQYPQTLFHATIRRVRAEQHITGTRAAIIKACINRFNRFHYKTEEEITVSLDKTNRNPAYLLGRLFAVLEKVQYKALKIETIRERYYGAFSSTPVTVYPQLMKLKNHHLAKLETGKGFYENLIGEIVDGLDGSGLIPRQFSLDEQGRFAVGYYHQRQDLKFKGNEDNTEKTEENNYE